ncbi:hypothetical protein NQ317_014768 [Molorchus minor]|uniref:Retrotransposon gag domain-containing protein n=1 Tax=Molorchus minor TaxID=1323400 RepID=A0ABQ9JAH7_9CUCU|nr:hypothetical protein NQ317_014768 [Molorchus minor]
MNRRHRSRKRSTSSSSSSSSDEGQRRRPVRTTDCVVPSTSRSYTPPVSQHNDKIARLENLSECIPEFYPGNPNMAASKWIEKIEQLKVLNNWDEPAVIFHMQNRLTGLAKKWYDNLPSYKYIWVEWKDLLVKSFPEHQDFASRLWKMLQRSKTNFESWERYYFEKTELLSACDINGKRAVSCLIDGIPDPTIQAGARAGRYDTPDSLYGEYLSTLRTGSWGQRKTYKQMPDWKK